MCISADASVNEIEEVFINIADVIKNNCVVNYLNDKYRILDFEFYFYNKNHQDISVHPRKSDALCWYINDFGGIDLNFESKINLKKIELKNKCYFKYELTDDSFFGGVLIRQIQRLSDKIVYSGPIKVAELFRIIDATSHIQQNPVLEIYQLEPIDFEQKTRHNLLGTKKISIKEKAKIKADYIIKECYTDVPELKKRKLEEVLITFNDKKYRHCWKS